MIRLQNRFENLPCEAKYALQGVICFQMPGAYCSSKKVSLVWLIRAKTREKFQSVIKFFETGEISIFVCRIVERIKEVIHRKQKYTQSET